MDEMFMNELIVKYKVATCHYIYTNYGIELHWVLLIISDLQFTTSKRAIYISIRYKSIMNIISMKDFNGY